MASAFCSGSEAAFFSLTRLQLLRLTESGHRRAELVRRILDRPRKLLISILFGNEAINIIASALATSMFISLMGPGGKWVSLMVMTPVILIMCEIVPKSVALSAPERVAPLVARPLRLFIALVGPLRRFFRKMLIFFLRLMGVQSEGGRRRLRARDFLAWVDDGLRQGELAPWERDLIRHIVAFKGKRVAEMMTPRTEVFSASVSTPLKELVRMIKEAGYARVLITGDDPDDVRGLLLAKDLLKADPDGRTELVDMIRPPLFVPEARSAAEVFNDLREGHSQMAVVVDEYGGLAGLVTMTDLVVRLFGSLTDRPGDRKPGCRPIAPGRFVVHPRFGVEDFGERFGRPLPEGDYDTVGGFVMSQLGHLPEIGEKVTWQDFTFTVTGRQGTRLTGIMLSLATPDGEGIDAADGRTPHG